jgi:hypothetical protein
MWIPILLLAVSFLGLLVTVGLPRFRLVRSLPILTWPRMRTLVIHPTRAIAFQYSRRIFFGRFKLPHHGLERTHSLMVIGASGQNQISMLATKCLL